MDSAVRFSSCSSVRPSTQRPHSACVASQERCQVPGAAGQERGWQVPTWQVPRGFTEQHAPQNGSAEKDLTENGQFSSKVKSAKIHPRSSRNRNRPQTREETEKVVKGLTLRTAKATCDSSTWRTGGPRAGSRCTCSLAGLQSARSPPAPTAQPRRNESLGLVCPSAMASRGLLGPPACLCLAGGRLHHRPATYRAAELPPSERRGEVGGCSEDKSPYKKASCGPGHKGPTGTPEGPHPRLGASTRFPRLRYIFTRM